MIYMNVIQLFNASFLLLLPRKLLQHKLWLCCLLLTSVSSYSANSDEPVDFLVVAAENHLLQYQENGVNKGPTISILSAVLKESQLTADIHFMPWARAFDIAKHQPNVLILSIIRTPEREPYFHWLAVVSELARVFIYLTDKPENKVLNDEQAKQKVVGLLRGSAAYSELIARGFVEGKNLYLTSDWHQLFHLFINGKVDLIYADPNTLSHYLESSAEDQVKISYETINSEHKRVSYIAASKGTDEQLLKRFNVAMKKFQQSAQYMQLKNKE